MRNCSQCGFPKMLVRISDWRGDGTILFTDRTGTRSQVTCLECEDLESLFAELSDKLGMPVDRLVINAQKSVGKAIYSLLPVRHYKHIPSNRFFRPQWLSKLVIRIARKDVAALGFGIIYLDGYHAGESMTLRFSNPCLVPRIVGSALGLYESLEKMPAGRAEYALEGDDLVIHMSHAEEADVAEERLQPESVEPGTGPLSYEMCASCGATLKAAEELEWDLERGIIRNRRNGGREAIIAVQSINAIQREFERELGDDFSNILYDAQKRITKKRVTAVQPVNTADFWERYLADLALRGLGYPTAFDASGGSVTVEISNAYNQTLYAAKIAAAFEAFEGTSSSISWEKRAKGHAAYSVSAGVDRDRGSPE